MVPADRVQPQHVAAFHQRMQRKYGSQVFDKNVHDAVQQAVEFARRIGVVDARAYLKSYAFTLGVFIWYPFDVVHPAPVGDWTLPWQLITIAHEHVHVRQFKAFRGVPFAADYVTSAEARAMRWEAEAYCVSLEVWRALYGDLPAPSPEQVVAPLTAYGCTPEQVQGAAEVVRTRYETIKRGGTLTPEARDLLDFLKSAQISG
jgi:hypothetical protein